MIPQIQIILPRTPNQQQIVQYVRVEFQIWRQETEARLARWKPYNIRHPHDPNWRGRVMSIQCCRDAMRGECRSSAGYFWDAIAILFVLGGLSLGYFRTHR